MQTPVSANCFEAWTARSKSISFNITLAPSAASCLHISKPIPCPAPVTIAVLFLKDIVEIILNVELYILNYCPGNNRFTCIQDPKIKYSMIYAQTDQIVN